MANKGKPITIREVKILTVVSAMLLTLYPIIELTRLIMIYWQFAGSVFNIEAILELSIMWTLYLAIVPVLCFIIGRIYNK